jgi:hypothetical protein
VLCWIGGPIRTGEGWRKAIRRLCHERRREVEEQEMQPQQTMRHVGER